MIKILDYIIAVLALLITLPLQLVIACMIVLETGFPIYFKHKRVGQFGKIFEMYKFRTMRNHSEDLKAISTGESDNRITKVGRKLRNSKLDELPQFLNVLRGEMSVVGYRPQVAYFVSKYQDLYEPLLKHKPGIVSTAAILYKNEEKILAIQKSPEVYFENVLIPEKCKLDAEDARKMSVEFYFATLIKFCAAYFLKRD